MSRIKEHIFKVYNKIPKAISSEVVIFVGFLCFLLVLFFAALGKLSVLNSTYSFIRNASELAFYFVVVKLIYSICAWIKNKKINNLKIHSIWLLILLIISLPHIPKVLGYGTTQIGSYYENSEYTEKYVVFMSRKPQKEKQRKVYTLVSQISRYEDYHYTDTTTNHITGEQTDKEVTMLCYHIEKLYFNNGGYLNFDEVDPQYTILEPDKEQTVKDNKDDTYYITLTLQKAQ